MRFSELSWQRKTVALILFCGIVLAVNLTAKAFVYSLPDYWLALVVVGMVALIAGYFIGEKTTIRSLRKLGYDYPPPDAE